MFKHMYLGVAVLLACAMVSMSGCRRPPKKGTAGSGLPPGGSEADKLIPHTLLIQHDHATFINIRGRGSTSHQFGHVTQPQSLSVHTSITELSTHQ